MRRFSRSLTARIFLITSALLIVACAITYITIAFLTPITYTSMLAEERSAQGSALIAQLEQVMPDACEPLLDGFVRQTAADVRLIDENGHVLYDSMSSVADTSDVQENVSQETMITDTDGATETMMEPDGASAASFNDAVALPDGASAASFNDAATLPDGASVVSSDDAASLPDGTSVVSSDDAAALQGATSDVPSSEDASEQNAGYDAQLSDDATSQNASTSVQVVEDGALDFSFADGTNAWLTLYGGTRAVNQATEAMGRVLPYLIILILLISLAGSYFYAWYITRPIVSISRIARRMASMDFDASWTGKRQDEIGNLGESLNLLSGNLSSALSDLEQANAQLKSDIEREREIENQRMAFFSAASHELKTPITILKGQLRGMLARVGVYEDRETYLARALTVTGRMESLVKEILTINRIGSGGFMLKSNAMDLSRLMTDQLELDQELIEQRQLHVEAEIEPNVIVSGDEALISKVLDNVLTNAILYSPAGAKVRVHVADGGFSVTNSGATIPEESIDQLFTPFYRVEQSRNRKSGGSGLGLYLVRTILALHGARFSIQNMPEGVRFEAQFDQDAQKESPNTSFQ
ncbi:HAMP domain-containing protein [Eubacteriales bacterium OttesenSCG-928-N13]|nr:HAMP domain-containing protein [Eubacteriales bacterium OttesenSCG-928-N13]